MLFRHIGHAEFLIVTENGHRIVTDPYDETCGYPVKQIRADTVLVSHQHHDHNAVGNVTDAALVVDTTGQFTPAAGIGITALDAYHDDTQGTKRGKTLLFLIEAEGLRVAHLGDLGCNLNEGQLRTLGEIDVLMIPVGGFFTIDAAQAKKIAEQLHAKVILPMHFRTEANADWPIAGPEDFLALYGEEEIARGGEALRVTKGDLVCQKRVVLL